MHKFHNSVYIDASPQRVWDFISDMRRGPEWVTVMQELLYQSDDPIRVGSSYRERSKIGPSLSETEWRITRFDPPHIQVHECREPLMHAVLTMRVEPDGDGARLLHEVDAQLFPGFRPLGWLLERLFVVRIVQRDMRQSVANAQRILEAEERSAASGAAEAGTTSDS